MFTTKKNCLIDTETAYRDYSYRDCYFTKSGIGDSLMLLASAEIYYETYGQKLLIITKYPELFENCDFCHVLNDFKYDSIQKNIDFKNDSIKINGFTFKITFLCVEYFVEYKDTKFLAPKFPTQTPMLARLCERLGIEGKILIDPQLYLTKDEKSYGNFYRNQITIINNGSERYKAINPYTVQEIVDELKDKYKFVQVGFQKDPKIENAFDMRGRLTLRQIASVLFNSKMFVGGIGGMMHLAKCVGCKSVIAYSSAESEKLYGYDCNKLVLAENPCQLCVDSSKHLLSDNCNKGYRCINKVKKEDLVSAIVEMMEEPASVEPKMYLLQPSKVQGLSLYKKWLRRPPRINGLKTILSLSSAYDRKSFVLCILGIKFEIKNIFHKD